MLKREAKAIVGGLSNPAKMPCKSYGLPAEECKVGSALRKIAGSVCSDCYALKGQYQFSNVQAAQYRRLDTLYHPDWVDAMVTLIKGMPFFRWHDSGDIQCPQHLHNIFDVCERTPDTQHWMPTREKATVRHVERQRKRPENLVIRVSAPMIDGEPPKGFEHTSGVATEKSDATCPAYKQDGECGDCRRCWDTSVSHVDYPLH